MRLSLLVLASLFSFSSAARGLSKSCRDLLGCAVRKNCIKVNWLKTRFSNQPITAKFYDDVATGIDYGCIFNSGCNDECNSCPLCMSSKLQLTDVLSGENGQGDCETLVNCATACIARAGAEGQKIIDCLLHGCAFHCFNGSCSKCSAFTTRVFNQACVSGDLRHQPLGFSGQCTDMFRTIVYHKFQKEFDGLGRQPSIGHE